MKSKKTKRDSYNKTLYWIPRILGILYVVFLSIFAFDVFSELEGIRIIRALFVHLIPSLVLLVLLVWGWKKPFQGGIAWIVLAIIFTIFFKTYTDVIVFAIISLPILLVGIFFLIEGNRYRTS